MPINTTNIWLTLHHTHKTPKATDHNVNLTNQIATTLTLATLTTTTIKNNRTNWTKPHVLTNYTMFAAALTTFVHIKSHNAHPMLPLNLFHNRTFSTTNTSNLLLNITMYNLIFILNLFFQHQQNHNTLKTKLTFAPITNIVITTNINTSQLTHIINPHPTILLNTNLTTTNYALLLNTNANTPYTTMIVQLVAFNTNIKLIVPLLTSKLLNNINHSRSNITSNTLNTMRQTNNIIKITLYNSLLTSNSELHTTLTISITTLTSTNILATLV